MKDAEFDSINVIPLVDVMLVLLTIVLTTSTFIASGAIPVALPKAESGHAAEQLKSMTIEIDASGRLYLNSRLVDMGALSGALGPLERTVPVVIRADREVALQSFVDVLDLAKRMGFSRISLQTENVVNR